LFAQVNWYAPIKDFSFHISLVKQYPFSPSLHRNSSSFSKSWEMFRSFPDGAKQLYYDCLTYQYINDASKNKHSSWQNIKTIQDKDKATKRWTKLPHLHVNDHSIGYIPRRQKEQQRRLIKDLLSCAPVVTLWGIIPVFGNAFVVLGIIFPRLLLSRHFYNEEKMLLFLELEYIQKLVHYEKLASIIFTSNNFDLKSHAKSINSMGDAAGLLLTEGDDLFKIIDYKQGDNSISLNTLSREHLLQLSLATGIFKFTNHLNAFMVKILPLQLVKYFLKKNAKEIINDDAHLIREQLGMFACHMLTDEEVLVACAMRGLPTTRNISIQQMRECLSNYLKLMEDLDTASKSGDVEDSISMEALELFVLHMQPIRYALRDVDNHNMLVK